MEDSIKKLQLSTNTSIEIKIDNAWDEIEAGELLAEINQLKDSHYELLTTLRAALEWIDGCGAQAGCAAICDSIEAAITKTEAE